jgi:hypothetical protein
VRCFLIVGLPRMRTSSNRRYYELAKTKEPFDTKVICHTVSGSVGPSKANLPSTSEAHCPAPPIASLTWQAKGLTKRSKVKILQ